MWSRAARPGRHLSLAGQFLLLQVTVLLLVLVVASVVSIQQSDADFRDARGDRLRSAAENLANTPAVRDGLAGITSTDALPSYTDRTRSLSGATAVYLLDPVGVVLVGPNPLVEGTRVDLGDSDVQRLRAWTGDVTDRGERAIAAHVPVIGDHGEFLGIAVVADAYPPLTERVAHVLRDLLAFLGIGLAFGVLASWLLARLIKRRTRGLEPAEIAALADQREALLHSIREGVVAVSGDGVVTVLSDSARELLGLPEGSEGHRLADLDLAPTVREALTGDDEVRDAVIVVAGRVVVLNRSPVLYAGRQVGTVTTLRDRTELLAMQSELSARESVTETLRAQTHEFSNQLHTISGLVQLGEYDEVSRLIGTLARRRAEISDHVTTRVEDPAVAALLIAKTSLAAERGVAVVLADDAALPRLDPDLSADAITVLGNLVDNAVDATVAAGGTRVDVRLGVEAGDRESVLVQVADTGAGVAPESASEIFRRGWSTKPGDASGRGVGLALVQVVTERRDGSVSVHNADGAVFTARLPLGSGA